MIVVSDASPLISLSAVGHLDLLKDLFGEVWIPDAVLDEVRESGAGRPGSSEVGALAWIKIESIRDSTLMRALLEDLDRGEAEAIALGVQVAADLVVMDERRGRNAAKRLGLRVVGVLGMLVAGKNAGLIPSVGAVLDRLVAEAGFRVSSALRDLVLRSVQEDSS